MKVCNADDRVHVLEGGASPYQTLANICESGVQEESFFVCDVDEIIRKFKEWTLHMPRVHPHYAVKCNDTQTVVEVLAALGTGFDCATKAEMSKVLDLGVDPSRIIYAHPCKIASHIRHAANNGVRRMTFDNETELYKVHSLFPTAKLVIRIRCDDETALVNLGIKYGCDAALDAPRLLAVAASLGLDVVGVSFHVGSGCRNPSVFRKAIGLARDVFDLAADLGFRFNLLDIGGGFSGSIAPVADVVNQALDELFPDPDVHVIAEPGRYFCDSAFTLAVNIHSRREIKSADGDIIHVSYYINDGVYGSFNGLLCDFRVVKGVPLRAPRTKLYPSTIWGQTCDGLDKIEPEAHLPMLELGAWIVYKSMGAYSVVTSTAFNGFPIPKVHMVCSKAAWRLLKERAPLSHEHFVLGNLPANIHMGLDIGGKVPMGEVARRLSVVSLQGHDRGHGDLRRTTSTGSLCSDGSSSADLEGFHPELFRSHDPADHDHELADHDHDHHHDLGVHELADLADNSPLMYDPFKLVL